MLGLQLLENFTFRKQRRFGQFFQSAVTQRKNFLRVECLCYHLVLFTDQSAVTLTFLGRNDGFVRDFHFNHRPDRVSRHNSIQKWAPMPLEILSSLWLSICLCLIRISKFTFKI